MQRRERGGGVAAQLVQAEQVAELLVEEGVPLAHGAARALADPGDHGQADVGLVGRGQENNSGHLGVQPPYTACQMGPSPTLNWSKSSENAGLSPATFLYNE